MNVLLFDERLDLKLRDRILNGNLLIRNHGIYTLWHDRPGHHFQAMLHIFQM